LDKFLRVTLGKAKREVLSWRKKDLVCWTWPSSQWAGSTEEAMPLETSWTFIAERKARKRWRNRKQSHVALRTGPDINNWMRLMDQSVFTPTYYFIFSFPHLLSRHNNSWPKLPSHGFLEEKNQEISRRTSDRGVNVSMPTSLINRLLCMQLIWKVTLTLSGSYKLRYN
jgi:hypothetical protein